MSNVNAGNHRTGGVRYRAYGVHNFRKIPQIERLTDAQRFDIEVVGQVLPFKVNNFVIDQLIDWEAVPDDPLFVLTFPQRGMLRPEHYDEIAGLLHDDADTAAVRDAADRIRLRLNPDPSGQLQHNVPLLDGEALPGMQHKYQQTVLFFPSQGQTCHAYCSFCFRWPQFTGMSERRFASREVEQLVAYVGAHPEVSDVLFTGGDPLVMSAQHLGEYVDALLDAGPDLIDRFVHGGSLLARTGPFAPNTSSPTVFASPTTAPPIQRP